MNVFISIVFILYASFISFLGYNLGRKVRHDEWRECLQKHEDRKDIFICALESK